MNGVKITPFGAGGGEALSKEFKIPLLAQFPIDPMVSKIGDEGKSLFLIEEAKQVQELFFSLAIQIEKQLQKVEYQSFEVRQGSTQHLEFFFDNMWHSLPLDTLQRHCPCARCERGKKIQKEVALLEFSLVGRYAVRIRFSSGCSRGIYPFSLIKQVLQQ
jgi:ATP-binding protein involved in chromosome partitioning